MCVYVFVFAWVYMCMFGYESMCVCILLYYSNHTLKAIIATAWGVLDTRGIDTVVQALLVKWDSSNSEKKNQDQSHF